MSLSQLKKDLQKLANPKQTENLQRFFKTKKGQYGEGDVFLGIKVPDQRIIVKKYLHLNLDDLQDLLHSKIHEYRLVALLILVEQFQSHPERSEGSRLLGRKKLRFARSLDSCLRRQVARDDSKKQIFYFYLKNTKYINNWDLVDLTAPKIIGQYLLDKPKERTILYKLARSKNLWDKRISIMATFVFIRNSDYQDALAISKILLKDKHDLIHKAVGWMLREIGKIDQKIEEGFLKQHYKAMPRTMLRYSIEKFDKKKRDFYLGRL